VKKTFSVRFLALIARDKMAVFEERVVTVEAIKNVEYRPNNVESGGEFYLRLPCTRNASISALSCVVMMS